MQQVLCSLRRIAPLFAAVAASTLHAQSLPEGPGRDATVKLCRQCHEIARSISLRQDRDGWHTTINKMTAFGMKASDQDLAIVIDYLSTNFPADPVPRVNVNTARAIDLEAALSLRRSQAKALIEYREKNGDFKTIDDLKKVPMLDASQLEEKKDKIIF